MIGQRVRSELILRHFFTFHKRCYSAQEFFKDYSFLRVMMSHTPQSLVLSCGKWSVSRNFRGWKLITCWAVRKNNNRKMRKNFKSSNLFFNFPFWEIKKAIQMVYGGNFKAKWAFPSCCHGSWLVTLLAIWCGFTHMLMDCFDFCSILQPHSNVQSQPLPVTSSNGGNHSSSHHHHRSGLMNTTGETTVSAGLPDPDSDEQQEVIQVQILPQVSKAKAFVTHRKDFLIAFCAKMKDERWGFGLDDRLRSYWTLRAFLPSF